LKMDPRKVLF